MKVLGKIWSGIKWGLGKVWGAIKWAGGKVWGAAKSAYGFVKRQPTWKIALVGLAAVAAIVIASKLSKGGNDMDLFGEGGGGGNGIATAVKVGAGVVAVGAGAELGYRAYQGVAGKFKKGSSGGTTSGGGTPGLTPVTDVTLPGTASPGAGGKAPTSQATYQLDQGEEASTQGQEIEPVSDLDLNISDLEIQELEGELNEFEKAQEGPQALGFSATMSKVGAN